MARKKLEDQWDWTEMTASKDSCWEQSREREQGEVPLETWQWRERSIPQKLKRNKTYPNPSHNTSIQGRVQRRCYGTLSVGNEQIHKKQTTDTENYCLKNSENANKSISADESLLLQKKTHRAEENGNTTFQTEFKILKQAIWDSKKKRKSWSRNTKTKNRNEQTTNPKEKETKQKVECQKEREKKVHRHFPNRLWGVRLSETQHENKQRNLVAKGRARAQDNFWRQNCQKPPWTRGQASPLRTWKDKLRFHLQRWKGSITNEENMSGLQMNSG